MENSSSRRVGIRDVALAAGVSVATVSHVYNHRGRVSERTRARVRAVGDRLGYRPNRTGQALRSGRTNVIAVVASFRDSDIVEASFMPCFQNIVAGAAVGAGSLGLAVTVGSATTDGRITTPLSYDGVILVDPMPSDPVIEREIAGGRPVVALGGYGARSEPTLRAVRLDIRTALPAFLDSWAEGAPEEEQLRPSIFIGPRLDHFTNDAVAAYQRWCAGRGVTPQGGALEPGEMLEDAAFRILSGKIRPTLVHCMNESFSAAVLAAAARIGVRVPEDLRITTVGNPQGLSMQRGVDYLSTNPVENGAIASRLIVGMLDGDPVEDVILPLPHTLPVAR